MYIKAQMFMIIPTGIVSSVLVVAPRWMLHRAIVLRINHREDLFKYDDLIGGDVYVTNDVPHFITIPTTAGTGSEVGRSAIIADDETHQKKILFLPSCWRKLFLPIRCLPWNLPPFITAATGMDALTHNMEAFLAKIRIPFAKALHWKEFHLIKDVIGNSSK